MDAQTDKDFNLLSEENSDLDILLSPASGKSDDDDEVFLGPVRHVEKCVAIGIELNCKEDKCSKATEAENWSPSNTDLFFEVSKEANLLAQRFENHMEGRSKKMGNQMTHNKMVEQFIEESKLKLTLLKGISSPSCSRRETFVVQDSPLRLLPPAIQKRLQVNSQNAQPHFPFKPPMKVAIQVSSSSMQPQQNSGNPSLVSNNVAWTENNTSREDPSVKQAKNELAKHEPAKYDASEKPKSGTRLTHCGMKLLNNTSSDNLPDAVANTSNECDSPPHSNALGRKDGSLAAHQVSEPNLPGFKASNSMTKDRTGSAARTLNRTSLLSSGLHSHLHNSNSGGRVPLTMRSNASNLQTLKNSSRIASPKTKSSSSRCSIDVPRTSLTPANTCKVTAPGMMSQKGTGMQSLPNKGLQRISSTDTNVDTKVKSNQTVNTLGRDRCPKTKASVNSQAVKRSSAPSPGTARPKATQPKKLLSCSAVESGTEFCTPNKPPIRGMLQTPISNKLASITSATKRLSALPTPLNRRRSGIPTFTPQTQPRPVSSHKATTTRNRSMSASETILKSEQMSKKPEGLCSSDSSEEDMPPSMVPCVLDFSPDKPLEEALKHTSEPQSKENFTVEAGTKNKQNQDRPLIDLSNTPEIIRAAPMKAPEPLIDFNSPLIILSPANKENVNLDSPLLKF